MFFGDRFVDLFATLTIRMTRFGPKVGHTGPKRDKSGDFSDQIRISTFWLTSENVLNLI